jgi:hypothetical protein
MSVSAVCYTDRQQHGCPGIDLSRVIVDRDGFVNSLTQTYTAGSTCNADGACAFPDVAAMNKKRDNRFAR